MIRISSMISKNIVLHFLLKHNIPITIENPNPMLNSITTSQIHVPLTLVHSNIRHYCCLKKESRNNLCSFEACIDLHIV